MEQDIRLTRSEKARMAGLVARGAKRSLAGEGVYLADLDRTMERINDRAAERTARENDAMERQLHAARKAAATAKTALMAADRESKRSAKDALKRAQDVVRRTERAARRIGL